MESKRLNLSEPLPLIRLNREDAGDIVVPHQGAAYVIEQVSDEATFRFRLVAPETAVQIFAAVRTAGAPALRIEIIHEALRTRAETLVRTLATGAATPKFQGLIRIEPGASQCESYLNHHSLVFDQAKSYTWPALEIENNDVKCSHAATVKTITDADLFYLRSRGIPVKEARKTLIDAFFADLPVELKHA